MATCVFSADAPRASSGILPVVSTMKSSRREMLGLAVAGTALALTPTPWRERCDPDAWIERWYRLGNAVLASPTGEPMLWINMDADEVASAAMRGELGYPGNRPKLIAYLRDFPCGRPGAFSTYRGKVA